MELVKSILRWIFCIPLGVIGGTSVQLLSESITRYVERGSVLYIIEILIAGGLGGAAVVYIAAYVAPSHRAWVAIFLSVIFVVNIYFGVQTARADGDWLSVLLTLTQTGGAVFLTLLVVGKRITFAEV
jgi:hypothetical protein